jgi:hypothetical protein
MEDLVPLRLRLLLGPLAAAILAVGIIGLAWWIPGYSHVRQTVSEIGEIGSPVQLAFALLLGSVSACTLAFAGAVHELARRVGQSPIPAYVIGAMGVSAAGIALFPHPHPLHNVFGLSELIGYQAPLAFALAWRRSTSASTLAALSWALYVVIVVAIALNLSALPGANAVWSFVQPRQGLAQRVLFAAWFGWIGVLGSVYSTARWPQTTGRG